MAKKQATAQQNRFLARLPEHALARLLPHLRPVTLEFDQTIYESRGPIEYAYFPIGAVLSALTIMEDGSAIEVATIGNEGLVGYSLTTGGMRSVNRVIAQIADGALRIEARILREEAVRDGPLKDLLGAYHDAYMAQVSQSVACNGLHTVEKRCCRWLLMTRDRVGSDALRLTHEFLAIMLGVRRASITDVLKPLQEAKLVRSHRGIISILDGAKVEAHSCECYRAVREEYDRLLDGPRH